MKLLRERPSQRLHHRVEAPLYVEIDGVSQETAREALTLGAAKLPIKTKFVARLGAEA